MKAEVKADKVNRRKRRKVQKTEELRQRLNAEVLRADTAEGRVRDLTEGLDRSQAAAAGLLSKVGTGFVDVVRLRDELNALKATRWWRLRVWFVRVFTGRQGKTV